MRRAFFFIDCFRNTGAKILATHLSLAVPSGVPFPKDIACLSVPCPHSWSYLKAPATGVQFLMTKHFLCIAWTPVLVWMRTIPHRLGICTLGPQRVAPLDRLQVLCLAGGVHHWGLGSEIKSLKSLPVGSPSLLYDKI